MIESCNPLLSRTRFPTYTSMSLSLKVVGGPTLRLCLMLLCLTACSRINALTSNNTLIGPTWVLENIDIYGQQSITLDDERFSLRLNRTTFGLGPKEGRYLEGSAGCNQYHGKYLHKEDDGAFLIIFLFHTNLYCGEDSLDWLYYEALSQTTTYTIVGEFLLIEFGEERSILVFKAE